jgi:hypothetical protein
VDEVAIAAAHAALAAVEATAGLAEVGDGRKLAVDGAAGVPARVERIAGGLCIFFVLEASVDVADEVCGDELTLASGQDSRGWSTLTVVIVVADDDFFDEAVLAHLAPKVLVEGVEVALQLLRAHIVVLVIGRVLVEVREEDGLRVRGLDMLAGAAVTVTAGADLVVETTIDLDVKY